MVAARVHMLSATLWSSELQQLLHNKKPITAATISHGKPWAPVYSGEYVAID